MVGRLGGVHYHNKAEFGDLVGPLLKQGIFMGCAMKMGYISLSNMFMFIHTFISPFVQMQAVVLIQHYFLKQDRNIQGCLNCYQADACLLS